MILWVTAHVWTIKGVSAKVKGDHVQVSVSALSKRPQALLHSSCCFGHSLWFPDCSVPVFHRYCPLYRPKFSTQTLASAVSFMPQGQMLITKRGVWGPIGSDPVSSLAVPPPASLQSLSSRSAGLCSFWVMSARLPPQGLCPSSSLCLHAPHPHLPGWLPHFHGDRAQFLPAFSVRATQASGQYIGKCTHLSHRQPSLSSPLSCPTLSFRYNTYHLTDSYLLLCHVVLISVLPHSSQLQGPWS